MMLSAKREQLELNIFSTIDDRRKYVLNKVYILKQANVGQILKNVKVYEKVKWLLLHIITGLIARSRAE